MSDWRRRKWQARGTSNSIARKLMVPRISMIVALDTDGHVYLSLTQSNTNSKVMELFIRQLVRRLDSQRPGWRKNSVVMMDNATYHTNSAFQKILALLEVPVLYTGPHSY